MKTTGHFFIISRSILFRMRNVSARVVEELKTHILYSIIFFYRKSYLCENKVETFCRAEQATDNMAHEHFVLIIKATQTQTQYVILKAFPHQQLLQERASCYVIRILPDLLSFPALCAQNSALDIHCNRTS